MMLLSAVRVRVGPLAGGATATAVAASAAGLWSTRLPMVGAPVLALAIGVVMSALLHLPATVRPGLTFVSRSVLPFAIVLSGFNVSFSAVVGVGAHALPVTVGTIAYALIAGAAIGRIARLEGGLTTLISVGTAICGASAIAAAAAVIEADGATVALALAVIFCFNVLAALTFPPLGHVLHLSQSAFGLWAGTAINDTSSVVAAGYAYGIPAGTEATIVKLGRATSIVPLVAALAIARVARASATRHVPWRRIIPWFIGWFALAACANSIGLVPPAAHPAIQTLSLACISAALAAIGLQTDLRAVVAAGRKPLILGFFLWSGVAITSLLLARVCGL